MSQHVDNYFNQAIHTFLSRRLPYFTRHSKKVSVNGSYPASLPVGHVIRKNISEEGRRESWISPCHLSPRSQSSIPARAFLSAPSLPIALCPENNDTEKPVEEAGPYPAGSARISCALSCWPAFTRVHPEQHTERHSFSTGMFWTRYIFVYLCIFFFRRTWQVVVPVFLSVVSVVVSTIQAITETPPRERVKAKRVRRARAAWFLVPLCAWNEELIKVFIQVISWNLFIFSFFFSVVDISKSVSTCCWWQ